MRRVLRNGSETIRLSDDDIARFWSFVLKTEDCWIWTGGLTDKGYGRIKLDGKMRRAHVVSYLLLVGPLDDEDTLDHSCLLRTCVRPGHLEPMTDAENTILAHVRAGLYEP